MSLLDSTTDIIQHYDIKYRVQAWIQNHLPIGWKERPNIFLSDNEYNDINEKFKNFDYMSMNYMGRLTERGLITFYDTGLDHMASTFSTCIPKMYLNYNENNELVLELLSQELLILEDIEDIPNDVMAVLLPLMNSQTYVPAELEQIVIRSRYAYRKGRIIFNYKNPLLMQPHNTVYVEKYEF